MCPVSAVCAGDGDGEEEEGDENSKMSIRLAMRKISCGECRHTCLAAETAETGLQIGSHLV